MSKDKSCTCRTRSCSISGKKLQLLLSQLPDITINSNRSTDFIPFEATLEISPTKAGNNLITMDMIEANIQKYNLFPFPNFTGVLDYSIAKDVKFHVKFTNIAYNIKLLNLKFDEQLISRLDNFTKRNHCTGRSS